MDETTVGAIRAAGAAGVPVLLWGPPGAGKSSLICALAAAENVPCEVVIGSVREPSDFAGLPVVGDDGTVSMAPPAWARRLADAPDGSWLFLDELSTAPPAVQAALLRVVLDRHVGDLALPPTVRVVAAANPPEQAADGWDLSAPLANRFLHLDVGPSAATFIQGIGGGWVTPTTAVEVTGAVAGSRLAEARGQVAGFIHHRPDLLLQVPRDPASAGRPWPSPRTWDMLANVLARVPRGDTATASLVARGLVGEGAAVEFLTWRDYADLPDPEALLADPSCFAWNQRPDRVLAALAGVTAVIATHTTKERWAKGWSVLGAAAGAGSPDVAAVAARALLACRPGGAPIPKSARAFAPVLRDAGLLSEAAA